MRFSFALSMVPLAISVGAITLTEPKKGDNITPSSSVDVKWTSVDTDASSFDIYLVNNAVYPPVNKKLASDIETSKDSYSVNVGDIPNGHGYQIDLMSNDVHNSGILAQTGQFNVTGSADSSSTASTASSTSSTSSTMTGTSTTVSTTATPFTTEVVSTSTGASTTVEITHAVTSTPASGMTTAASSGAASGSASATPSTGAGVAVLAHPAAVGVIGGALALML
ncbi:Ser-Thr-rich glycosyl-phosphatidyl-inositol-anchored membrane family-domain-containing protein [Penicillium angulare]|uniref:Ser-Thr-rich glycosyl-phosphatidyl-inositol-anchored membrane family-domain-containing protein n=1 Tax=Penicillium angulare TaxID=116970 RepID=UPI0025400B65|nr:Ser-Thr-rich glycosyl-phosphatidyl-inositol-anchored membrane family-domain-containing protein [Penicillium angulare]KAJ5273851.1 Ser-Thr-rich glycosyl-phosphatidyl-inositol-anchored membrane family-domain-containing protein [Penicillium angulare]